MDAFYASIEQRDNPELRGVPIAVGGTGGRGVVATASYEARKYGIHSAMPAHLALRIYPRLVFVQPNFEKYQQVSAKIHEIFRRYTPIIEPLSLDEAFLDVTYSDFHLPSATLLAKQIKKDIQEELNLIASAGISYNKFLAKIASDQDKPDGLFVILPEQGPEFIKELPIEKFFGVGKVTAERMKDNDIFKGADLLRFSKIELYQLFGKMGGFLYNIARGIDYREVKSERKRKSVGVESTFPNDIVDEIVIIERFTQIFEAWWKRYQSHQKSGKSVTLKVRNQDFETLTRSFTDENYITDKLKVRAQLEELLFETIELGAPLRLLGISISGFETNEEGIGRQLTLW